MHANAKFEFSNIIISVYLKDDTIVRQGAVSVRLVGHLPRLHLRTTSDRQLIREPLAVVGNLCDICRFDDTSLSGVFINWTEQKQIIQHDFIVAHPSKSTQPL